VLNLLSRNVSDRNAAGSRWPALLAIEVVPLRTGEGVINLWAHGA